ncbi:MAG: Holliday junction resolvase RuvX [Gammaproteobacteria bacterium]|nr:Holliday junction resolvase RuvX [Gammaproteobacteria bacterium]MBT4078541.1 Holliday junction resolvase RuvX [Gammaproteobacteria bacterium]MBT4195589.1 Holliday junction resolvase RuvX [Gammaproteobacteria bacterium]MBT4448673.1 Holliday junction resolvase RuvX [Gammaproteobacteria bacterium]MBT4862384.1 Holliday junction resolvase RuvX [Gammaproteobacteria bacterium]
MAVIGFDFGTSWIGTAIGQTLTNTASPLQGVRVINNKPDWQSIEKIIKTWQPEKLIVGLPTSMRDIESPMTEKAKRFSRQLEGRFHIKTELVDERLTTREAWQIVEESAHKKVVKEDIDCIAAVLITETWLNQQ